ncbi:MAG: FAD-binding protein [Chlorobia bacterium]|nr:FAD-binding protein [Fimbriimonadaceae bacterium]
MSETHEPTAKEEVAEIVKGGSKFFLRGSGSLKQFSVRSEEESYPTILLEGLNGIIDFSPNDQVVNVRAGTRLSDVGFELEKHGQSIPYLNLYEGFQTKVGEGTVGGSLSMNLPHFLERECGTWRDWILGLTVILADGTICKSGSHAVKSVAGYDVHKLFVGARGTLGVVTEVILRTYPSESLPKMETDDNWHVPRTETDRLCFHRVTAKDYEEAWSNAREFYSWGVPKTSTILVWLPPDRDLPRFPGDQLIRSGCGAKNLELTDPIQIKLMKRAKQIFDPTNKLNPGEWGFM